MENRTITTPKLSLTLPDLPKEATSKLHLTWHWAASTYQITENLTEHYHFVISEYGKLTLGVPLINNVVYEGHPRPAGYAKHVLNANSNNIAISAASMANSYEFRARTGEYGPFPMTPTQVDMMIEVAAILCYAYGIPVLPTRVLGHEEWDSVNGFPQDRWDVNCIPHLDVRPHKNADGTYDSTNLMRNRVRTRVLEIAKDEAGAGRPLTFALPHEITDAQKALYGSLHVLPFTPLQRQAAESALNDYNRVLHDAGLK